MYVALKNMFGLDSLDNIILGEYARLELRPQTVYRMVSALEAAGTKVHRQLVIRLLNIESEDLKSVLKILDGLLEEYDINPADGLYGWRTRHEVVAKLISRYKFSDQQGLVELLESVIDSSNPTIYLERRSLADICNSEFGIKRVNSASERLRLYERIIEKAPAERVPHHRRLSELLRDGQLDAMGYALRDAQEAVGSDSPISRYAVLLTVERARQHTQLLPEDRVALLREASAMAERALGRFPDDKYTYHLFWEIAQARMEVDGSGEMLDLAIEKLRAGVEKVLDPQLSRWLGDAERAASR